MRSRLIAGIAAVVLAVAGTFVAAGSVVHAQRAHEGRFGGGRFGGPFGMAFGGRGPGLEMLHRLDLTDQQKQQVRSILESHRTDFQQVHEKIRAAFDAQRAASEATPVDEATIRAKATDVATAQADLVVLTAKIRAEVFQVLTPEQQAKAQELKAQREQRRQERLQQRQQKQQQPPAQK